MSTWEVIRAIRTPNATKAHDVDAGYIPCFLCGRRASGSHYIEAPEFPDEYIPIGGSCAKKARAAGLTVTVLPKGIRNDEDTG